MVFHPLGTEHSTKIVEIQLERLRARLAERRITLTRDTGGLRHLGERGYDPVYGARPLKRLIQQEIETPMARQLVKGELRDGDTATVDLKDGQHRHRADGDRMNRVIPELVLSRVTSTASVPVTILSRFRCARCLSIFHSVGRHLEQVTFDRVELPFRKGHDIGRLHIHL